MADEVVLDAPQAAQTADFDDPSLTESAAETPANAPAESPEQDTQGADAGAPAFAPELLQQARAIGWNDEDLKGFGSPQAAEHALRMFDRQMAQTGRGTGQPAPTPGRNAPPPPASTEAANTLPDDFAFKFDPDFEEIDPTVTKAVKAMNEHYAKIFKGLAGQLSSSTEFVQRQQETDATRQFDDAIDALGMADVFGTRDERHTEKTPAHEASMKVLDETLAIMLGYQQRGVPLTKNSMQEITARVAQGFFPRDTRASVTRGLSAKLQKQRGQFLPRASGSGQNGNGGLSNLKQTMQRIRDEGKFDDEAETFE